MNSGIRTMMLEALLTDHVRQQCCAGGFMPVGLSEISKNLFYGYYRLKNE